ncbi:triphosphoribosyl-dephospho-CoA synthase [Alienimonas californiensis]|uniref:ATP:dephospho-CoA triphosphoribosyl transferase n=1 Tax=Alienimonas californiensis TaxID=2527989 RepID=A0A517PDW1_9PLAN|nr:triphosphoribosyl-dephospho-CoA synthase [Alienimonas californiensis]QDT17549.1 ATP:dephospho-CoA triphosphoribosyl transferase [Alienimonas californiensis]
MNLSELVRRACLTECTARKPGNVYPGADFADLTYAHFVAAAHVAAETLPAAAKLGVGPAVLNCVRATRRECGTNVNLGIALLLAPLCAVPEDVSLADGVGPVLAATTVKDAWAVYEAIRLASPGGLGETPEQDVRDEPTVTLTEAMTLAANRDRIARQYAVGFDDVRIFAERFPLERTGKWESATTFLYLMELSRHPDSHIARRCGPATAEEARIRAEDVVHKRPERSDWPVHRRAARELDRFLRGGSPRRNPGTTADLTCAALFWAGRERLIELPTEDELAAHAARLVRQGGGA